MYSPNVPRCQHIKTNGTQCGSPALRNQRFCYFHKKWHDQRVVINSARARRTRAALDLPVLEDADSVQVGLMQVMRLTLSGQLDSKTAGLMLYALQTASFNLRHTNFEPRFKHEIVIDPRRVDETLLGENVWENEDFPDPEEDPEELPEEDSEQNPEEDLQEDDLEENDDDPEPAAGEKGFEIQAVAAFPLRDTQGEAHSRQLPSLISSARHSSRARNRPTCPPRHSISWPLPPIAMMPNRPAAEHC